MIPGRRKRSTAQRLLGAAEARWPNANLSSMLSLNHWAYTSAESSLGTIVDSATGPGSVGGKSGLAASGIDWTGARATLNIVRAMILLILFRLRHACL